jgi:hypothetical protein
MCARIQLPLDILRYILSFFEEWRIVGDKFVHIANLLRIPRPTVNNYVKLSIFNETKKKTYLLRYNFDHRVFFYEEETKCYLLHYDLERTLFVVGLLLVNDCTVEEFYSSKNRVDWILD